MQFLLWITLFIALGNTICLFIRLFEKSLLRATNLCIMLCLVQGKIIIINIVIIINK